MFIFCGVCKSEDNIKHYASKLSPEAATAERPPAPENRSAARYSETESVAERCSRASAERPPEAPARHTQQAHALINLEYMLSSVCRAIIVTARMYGTFTYQQWRTQHMLWATIPKISVVGRQIRRSIALDSTYSYVITQYDTSSPCPNVHLSKKIGPPTQARKNTVPYDVKSAAQSRLASCRSLPYLSPPLQTYHSTVYR